jgi:hypothetical protein
MPKTTLDKCDLCNLEVINLSRHKRTKKHLNLYNHLNKKKEIALTNEKIEDLNIKNEIKELLSQLIELINKI